MTRARDEHLAWCKERALAYLEKGKVVDAITSMLSDLSKHEETKKIGEKMELYAVYLMYPGASISDVKHFIEGFR